MQADATRKLSLLADGQGRRYGSGRDEKKSPAVLNHPGYEDVLIFFPKDLTLIEIINRVEKIRLLKSHPSHRL